jgi:hypothetical protein
MSQNKTDYSENFIVECTMTSREYYDFRLLALTHQIQFLVKWEKTKCIVVCEAPFLAKCGYSAGVDF